MNHYEEKQAKRKERLENAAAKAQQSSNDSFNKARSISNRWEFGQPILVGHHSEGRHRRDIARMDAAMGKAVSEDKRAASLRSKAAGVGSGGISSDDPDAIEKLTAELEKLEKIHASMVATNKIIRSAPRGQKTEEKIEKLQALGLTLENAHAAFEPDCYGGIGFASYQLQNSNARIRSKKARIEQLKKLPEQQDPEYYDGEGEGSKTIGHATISLHPAINRIRVEFPSRITKEACSILKRSGFRWTPSAGCWQRHFNNASLWSAKSCAEQIAKLDNGGLL